MPDKDGSTRAADVLVAALSDQGVRSIYGVPGESYLSVLDALHEHSKIRFVTCRQEGGAAMAAESSAKLTGRPGICLVTRGPGATNASAGVHVAFQDSTPMILFIGQVARSMHDREAFQEIDYRRMFGQMAKWVSQIDDPERIQEYVARAFRIALSGRPGPVVLALPEDVLNAGVEQHIGFMALIEPARSFPAPRDLLRFRTLLGAAERPVVIVGGGGWTKASCAHLKTFAERNSLPVIASFRAQDRLNNDHRNYVGHLSVASPPYLAAAVRDSDLVVAIGPRLGEITTAGYTLLESPFPEQRLVHMHPSAEEIGHVYQPIIGINADIASSCEALAQMEPVDGSAWSDRLSELRDAFAAFTDPTGAPEDELVGGIVNHVLSAMPDSTIVTNGAGNYTAWVHRYHRYRTFGSQLAPTSGSMGYGLPAAIGAAIADPQRPVVCYAGDGCFMMTCQEMATAVKYQLAIIVIVINNGILGTIRAHQERSFPGRVSGTDLSNPNFADFARSFGAVGFQVGTLEDFAESFAIARTSTGPSLIEVCTDPRILAPGVRLKSMS